MRRTATALVALAMFGAMMALVPAAEAIPVDSADRSVTTRDLPAGYDLFETDPQQTQFDFGGLGGLPADFFAPGSQPFNGTIKLCGRQLGSFGGHDVGDADTVVQRLGAMTLPGPGSSATVPIELVQLNLVSCEPITVQVGTQAQIWDVQVDLSPTQRSQGTMTVHQAGANGGTFDSQLLVLPRFTFIGPGGATQTKDLGTFPTLFSQLQTQASKGVWNRRCELPALRVQGLNGVFCPGLTPKRKKQLGVWQSILFQIAWVPAQPRLEHFACYRVNERGQRFSSRRVRVTDQFGTRKPRLVKPRELCNPAQKNSERFLQKRAHLKCYAVRDEGFQPRTVTTRDQFGSLTLTVKKPRDLCAPSLKRFLKSGQRPTISGQPDQRLVDRFMCYKVAQQGNRAPIPVKIRDQFGRMRMTVQEAVILCNPARVNRVESYHPIQHLVCYRVVRAAGQRPFRSRLVQTSNQFGREALRVAKPETLCVPANKVVAT